MELEPSGRSAEEETEERGDVPRDADAEDSDGAGRAEAHEQCEDEAAEARASSKTREEEEASSALEAPAAAAVAAEADADAEMDLEEASQGESDDDRPAPADADASPVMYEGSLPEDEELKARRGLAERAGASSGMTSFIVSEEPCESSQGRQRRREDRPPSAENVVELPPADEADSKEGDPWHESTSSPSAASAGALMEELVEGAFVDSGPPRCTMLGEISDEGKISGRWGMTKQAHEDASQTSRFEYRRVGGRRCEGDESDAAVVAAVLSGSYSGHFCLQVQGKAVPTKVEEKDMRLDFVPNQDGRLNVRGSGRNRYGPFAIEGACNLDGAELELFRVYSPKPAPTPKSAQRSGGFLAPTPRSAASPVYAASAATTPAPQGGRRPSGKDLSRVQAALQSAGSACSTAVSPRPGSSSSRSHKKKGAAAAHVREMDEEDSFASPSSRLADDSAEGKRSGRQRKAPSHLRGGLSAAAQRLPEPMRKCHAVLTALERHAGANWFLEPVDAHALGVPHYPQIVHMPMDLGTVKRKLEEGAYADPHAFAAETRLVMRNAMTFNVLPDAPVHEAARDLHDKFEDHMRTLWKQLNAQANAASAAQLAGGDAGAATSSSSSSKTKGKSLKRDAQAASRYEDEYEYSAPSAKRAKSGKGKGKGKKLGPRDDDDGYERGSGGAGMVPVGELLNMQQQMEQMQATIAALQRQASQTEVQVQMNLEMGYTPQGPLQGGKSDLGSSGKQSAAAAAAAQKSNRPLTFQEKEALSRDINSLPPEKLAHVVKIVQEHMPLTARGSDAEEIEVDIETLDNETLRHLQRYVKTSLNAIKKKRGGKADGKEAKAPKAHAAPQPPEPERLSMHMATDALESVAFGGSGLGPGFDSDEDEEDLAYDVLGDH